MENNTNTDDDNDDDRQTPSTHDQNSSDDISSVSTETLLPAHENDQQQISNINHVRVCPVKTDNHISLPNLNIKHPNRPDDDYDNPFNDEKRTILDKHVKVSHMDRASVHRLNAEVTQLRLNTYSKRKRTGTVTVYRGNQRPPKSINGNLNNRETTQIKSRQSTVRVNRISTADSINQGSNQKIIASKPMVTRISTADELLLKMKQQKETMMHVSVQSASLNSKKPS